MFDAIYEHRCANQLLTPNQSGFRPGDSTVNQLLSITHKIHSAFEEFRSRETRAVFLEISKAFDKVWHDGLLFRLKKLWYFWVIIYSNKGLSIQSSTTSCLKRKKARAGPLRLQVCLKAPSLIPYVS